MTVKSIRGRRRYIAFRVDPSLSRRDIINDIPGGRHFNVIQCEKGMAAVRCAPEEIEECISAVRHVDPSAEPLRTSGTLRTLRDRYGILRETKPPKPIRRRFLSFFQYIYNRVSHPSDAEERRHATRTNGI